MYLFDTVQNGGIEPVDYIHTLLDTFQRTEFALWLAGDNSFVEAVAPDRIQLLNDPPFVVRALRTIFFISVCLRGRFRAAHFCLHLRVTRRTGCSRIIVRERTD